jgi:nitrate reductase gamma subunit
MKVELSTVHRSGPMPTTISTAPGGVTAEPPRSAGGLIGLVMVGCALLTAGLLGLISAAWGYALFVLAGLSFGAAVLSVGTLLLTRLGHAGQLAAWSRGAGKLGAVSYVLSVAALAGHYAYETLNGRMELHWVVFGPLVLAALVAFEWGIYRKLVKANAVSWQRYRRFIDRNHADPAAMRKTLVDEVITHRSLWQSSKLRWLRHTLIFWGFAAMFVLELAAVFVREAVPAFGWTDVWRVPGHPLRLMFDLGYDFTGLMMLLGCILALYWRYTVRGKAESKYADTPMVLFLGFVVVTGFMIEGWRLAQLPSAPEQAFSFVGLWFAAGMSGVGLTFAGLHQPLWLVHVVASCALIAYLPATRLIHTCATPLGRLMNSQKGLLQAKKQGVLAGLWRHPPADGPQRSSPAATSRQP